MNRSLSLIKLIEGSIADQYLDNEGHWYDIQLRKYTINPMDKYLLKDVWDDLIEHYPLDKDTVVYRGLNFSDEKQYLKFKSSINGDKISIDEISSWAPSRGGAFQFAITRPCYMEFMDEWTMKQIQIQTEERELMSGYCGVILKTVAKSGTCVDVRKFKNRKEPEILLPPGEYKIEIEEVRKFKDTLTNKDPNSLMMTITPDNFKEYYYDKLFNWLIWKYQPNDFNEKSKMRIVELTLPKYKDHIKSGEKLFLVKEKSTLLDEEKIEVFGIDLDETLIPYYPKTIMDKLIKNIRSELKRTVDEIYSKWTPDKEIVYYADLPYLAELCGMSDYFINQSRKYLQTAYQNISDAKEINKIKDPKEKNKAIQTQSEKIIKLLKSIS